MSKLYVGNISWDTSEAALAECFRQYGDVLEAKIIMDRETGRSKGFGFVTMGDAEQARAATEKLDGHMLDGRPLRVNEAQEKSHRGGYGGGGGGERFLKYDSLNRPRRYVSGHNMKGKRSG